MPSKLKIAILIMIGAVGYGVWALMAWNDPSLRTEFLHLNMAMVSGTIGLVLRDMNSPPPPPPPPSQPTTTEPSQ
jgi:hypothetical protein